MLVLSRKVGERILEEMNPGVDVDTSVGDSLGG